MRAMKDFSSVLKNRHDYARAWKARTGGKVIGDFCIYVPEELLYGGGILPVRVMGTREPEDVTEPYITSWWCPHCRSSLAEALKGRYNYIDGIILANTCPHIYQTYLSWTRNLSPGFSYDMYMPMNMRNRHAEGFVTQEFEVLKGLIEEWLGKPITEQALRQSIEVYNTNRRLMREIYELRKQDTPPISGAESLEMVLSSMVMDKTEHNKLLEKALKELKAKKGATTPQTRLMILGSENDDVELLRFIESMGTTIVADELCTGSRYFWGGPIDSQNPLAGIAHWYVDRPSSCPHKDIMERRRIPHIMKLAEEYRIQGVILLLEKFCEPQGYDLPLIKSTFEKKGIPFLLLEVDLTTPAGQFSTRIEAFLEVMRS